MYNIRQKGIVQNAENKKNGILKSAKQEENNSKFGLTVDLIASSFEFSEMEYDSTLAEDIIRICQKKGIYTDGQFQNETYVLRNQYTYLKNNKGHILKKELLFAVFIGLKLRIETVEKLMEKAGFTFVFDKQFEEKYNLPSFERLIYDCISLRIYNIEEINKFLSENGYKQRIGSKSLI